MSAQLLQTKLVPPQPVPERIARPRLVERLRTHLANQGKFQRKLTLISAPAGYGKTTLALEWLGSLDLPAAWLALDESDNDPLRLLNYLVAALSLALPGVQEPAQSMLEAPQPPPYQAVLTAIINQLNTLDQCLLLVLDDYHLLVNPQGHAQLSFLLEHQPDCLHLVLLSREDPPLALHRLRARRQMLELRQEDLRFSSEEAGQFFSTLVGPSLSPPDIEALNRRTEGWASGLQLAALSLQNQADQPAFIQSFTGSHRYVLDYLFEEVYRGQEPGIRSFLLATSILDRFSPELCDAVTGRADGLHILASLEKGNLFIVSLDAERVWYRYHRLFADLLRHQLQLEGVLNSQELHLRASRWFWEKDLAEEAVQHALAAEDWGWATRLVGSSVDAYLKRGEVVTLLNWFGCFPAGVFTSQPELRTNYAWVLMLAGRYTEAEQQLAVAEQEVQPETARSGEIYAAQAYAAQVQGDIPRMIELSQRALALLPAENYTSRGLVALNLGIAYWHDGRLEQAEAALQEAIPAAKLGGNTYGEITAQAFLARTWAVNGKLRQAAAELEAVHNRTRQIFALPLAVMDLTTLYYEWNQLDRAREYLTQSLEASQKSGNLEFLLSSLMLQARLQQAAGEERAAWQTIQRIRDLEAAEGVPERTNARRVELEVQLALAQADLDTACRLGVALDPHVDSHPFYRFLGLTPARLQIADGKFGAARDFLASAVETARKQGWGYGLVAALALKAAAEEDSGKALEPLSEALELAQPEGFVRTFVDTGERLVPRLQEAARRGIHPAYVGEILRGFQPRASQAAWEQPLVESLSERELEVLRLVAAGLSNRQIAFKLVISLNTAKSHVHNLCAKLEAQNRTQAVARARLLGLL